MDEKTNGGSSKTRSKQGHLPQNDFHRHKLMNAPTHHVKDIGKQPQQSTPIDAASPGSGSGCHSNREGSLDPNTDSQSISFSKSTAIIKPASMDQEEDGNGTASPHDQTKNQTSPSFLASHNSNNSNCLVHPSSPAKSHLDKEYSYGLCSFRPAWLQKLATKQSFLVIFCLTSVLQGMYYTYFVAVLTTIERLYQIQSKTTGLVMSATEIGQIGGALFLSYYGGQGHRPKWISAGILVFALASIFSSTPHFLYGQSTSGTFQMPNHNNNNNNNDSWTSHAKQPASSRLLCTNPSIHSPFEASASASISPHDTLFTSSNCTRLQAVQSNETNSVLFIFFISLFFIGIGTTAVNTLGIPYIDDNVAPRESPLYFGITIGVKIFGPVFGFLLGSFCTSIHVDIPFGNPSSLAPGDPQFIGAWWLGVLVVGICLLFVSLPMMAFPKKLSRPDPSSYCHKQQQISLKEQQIALVANARNVGDRGALANEVAFAMAESEKKKKKSKRPSLKGFPSAVKRLLTNQILLYRAVSSVLHILPIAGFYTFLPKYLESQFQLTSAQANVISGIAGILVMGFGIFSSGLFIRKYKPSAKFIAAWIALAALLYAIGMTCLMWLGCPSTSIEGLHSNSNSNFNSISSSNSNSNSDEVSPYRLNGTCSSSCSCFDGEFSPICSSEGVTYVSPCVAGCSTISKANSTFEYSDCTCMASDSVATNGICPSDCNTLLWYIVIFSLTVLAHSTSEVGSMMLTLRCVEPQDKAMALGLVSFAIALFGNVPCPILYGLVVDSTCLFWQRSECGQAGACRVYDSTKFRLAFHGVTAVIMFVAFFVDSIVFYKASHIKFADEEVEEQNGRTPDMEGSSKSRHESTL